MVAAGELGDVPRAVDVGRPKKRRIDLPVREYRGAVEHHVERPVGENLLHRFGVADVALNGRQDAAWTNGFG